MENEVLTEELAKNIMESCIDCGECIEACYIAKVTDNKYTPKSKIMLLQKLLEGHELEQEEIDNIYLSTGCGACEAVCPADISITDVIKIERAILAQQGKEPAWITQVCTNTMKLGNLGGEDSSNKNSWVTDELELSDNSDVAYMAGCWISVAKHDIARSTIKILNKGGIVPRLIPKEKCCGHMLIANGHIQETKQYVKDYVEYIESLGIKKLVVSCPGCYSHFMKEYPELFRKPDFEVEFSVSLFSQLIEEGKLSPKKMNKTVSVKDACVIMQKSDIPRKVLSSMGIEVKELTDRNIFCCGGPEVKPAFPEISSKVAMFTIDNFKETPDGVVSYCPFCYVHLEDVCKEKDKEMAMQDISNLLLESLS